MKDSEIVQQVKFLFDPTVSPGQAFDALFRLRQARMGYQEVFNAIVRSGKHVDEDNDVAEEAVEFECPGCGVARTDRTRCINPHCKEFKSNPVADAVRTERASRQPRLADDKFKDPIPTFGKYGKAKMKLTDIGKVDPEYLKWMAEEHEAQFWREQAKFAQLHLAAAAPHYRDTEATGFFG